MLFLLIPGFVLGDVFAEKLLVSAGKDVHAQFSYIDRITGVETQILDMGANGFLSGIAFSSDGRLIASASDESNQGDPGIAQVSFLINSGEPFSIIDSLGFDQSGNSLYSCQDISYLSTGELYCLNDSGSVLELIQVDIENQDTILIGSTGITSDSLGNALAIDSSDSIYMSNDDGLYQLDSLTAAETLIGAWTFPSNLQFCKPATMDFDSSGALFGSFECQDTFYLAEINSQTADLLSFVPITRNTNLSDLDLNMKTEPIIFTPFDFDFLIGNSYGTISSGIDSVSVSGTTEDGLEIQSNGNSFVIVCDDTSLSIDSDDLVNAQCHDSTIIILAGTVETVFEDDDGLTYTATLTKEDNVTFDSESSTITNNHLSKSIIVTFDSTQFIIAPGETISFNITTDHYLGYNSKSSSKHDHDNIDDKYNKYKKYERFYKYYLENPDSKKFKKFERYFKYFEQYYEKHSNQSDLQVTLVDAFEGESQYDVKKVTKLFNPVDKNNEGISDEESHLVEYQIKKAKGESKFAGIKNIPVSNQFGDLTIDIKSAKTLLVPSAKSHDSTPDELDEITINHFKCYNAKVSKNTPKFEKRDVSLVDQFGSMTMNAYKAKMFCSPVDKNNEGITNDENYLMCYDLKKIKGQPKFNKVNVFTNNQFGPEELKAEKPKRLCVPSTVVEPEPTTKFSIPINGDSDDAEEGNNSHHDDTMKLTSSDLDLTVEAEYVGLRFNNIPLDPRQTIEQAYIQFTSEDKDKGQSTVTIYGHNTANAPTFTRQDGDISSRTLTTESVLWNIPQWKDNKSGSEQQTSDLTSILQEIVNKPGWLNGNSAAFIFTNGMGSDKDAHTFDESPSKAAVLHIIVSDAEPIPDTFAPIISLLDSSTQQVIQNTPYVDAGATCLDDTDGVIPVIVTGDDIDTSILGSYQVTFDCTDSAGNAATQVTRTVNVVDGSVPVITLIGDSIIQVPQDSSYTDAGAICEDNNDADVTLTPSSSNVNTAIPGSYQVTFDCTDSAGNAATQVTRTVNVVDGSVPVITLIGDSIIQVPQDSSYTDAGAICSVPVITLIGDSIIQVPQDSSYTDAGAICEDNNDADVTLTPSSSNVNTSIVDTYQVTFDCTDSAGNAATQVTRTVEVVDVLPPTITLIGDSIIQVPQDSSYTDAGAICEDNNDADVTLTPSSSNVNTAIPGSYQVTFDCTDSADNTADTVTRIVQVTAPIDETAPIIILNGINPTEVNYGDSYTDVGATCLDETDAPFILTPSSSNVNTSIVDTYQVTFDCTDSAGNAATQVTRTVEVVDVLPPTITLIGDSIIQVPQDSSYTDAGAICEDETDADVTLTPSSSNVNTSIVDTYQVTFDCTDSAGNAATQVTRTVEVVDVLPPTITLIGDNPIEFGLGNSYTDAGAICEDNNDADVTLTPSSSNVNTAVSGSYQVTFDCTDSAGNAATQVTRTVNILSGATLTVNVTTDDSSSGTFNVKINGLTPQPVQSITTGIPFGPISIVPDTVTYTIIQLSPGPGYITGSSSCTINGIPTGTSQFIASSGDNVICTSNFIASSGGEEEG